MSLLRPTSFEAEQYRALRHVIEQLHKSDRLSIIAVSSPAFADGKSTTAINLAGALAQASEATVLLIDGDLRHSAATDYLGLDELDGPGLVDGILNASLALDDMVRDLAVFNLSFLPAGRCPSAPYEVLKSPRLGELLEEARRRYDYIVLDTAPLLNVPDCRIIAKWVDGFLVVVDAHGTPRRLVQEALDVLDPTKI
ncbi:MAG: CpsD/CapB family tyrosine-protein kinase, partial [Thermoanaerobaculia bacterium]